MPFIFKKLQDHGTDNPIVARLSLQTLQILKNTALSDDQRTKVGELYTHSLQRKLLRCWEIKERYREAFNASAESYEPPVTGAKSAELPQISRLEEECHNFLYETKNFVRDLLQAVNLFYGTNFKEASEFYRPRGKGSECLLDFAAKTFGDGDPQTKELREVARSIEFFVAMRNAVEHPGGYSGVLIIRNFTLEPDGRLCEPTWHREIAGKPAHEPSSIRSDLDTTLHNLLLLAEEIFISWAANNLKGQGVMVIGEVPESERDPKCAVRFKLMPAQHIAAMINRNHS